METNARRPGLLVRVIGGCWVMMHMALLALLIGSRVVDLSIYIPSEATATIAIADMLKSSTHISECSMCGRLVQIVSNKLLLANNPYYGLRTLIGNDDNAYTRYANEPTCLKRPCMPGCHGLVDRMIVSFNEETLFVFNETLLAARMYDVDMELLAAETPHVVSVAIEKTSQLLAGRFTMMREEEADLSDLLPSPFLSEEARIKHDVRPHDHVYDAHSSCIYCKRILPEKECEESRFERMVEEYLRLRSTLRLPPRCATCGLVQDVRVAYPVLNRMLIQGSRLLHSNAWFLQYPMNEHVHGLCYAHCEGKMPWRQRVIFYAKRLTVVHRLHECIWWVTRMRTSNFLLILIAYAVLFYGPVAAMTGNLVWRDTLHGVPVSDSGAAPLSGRLARNGVPLGASRFRKR